MQRKPDQMRDVKITTGFIEYAEGSCLFELGGTKVICNATVEEGVPRFLRGQGQGWVTSEYSMLPRSGKTRMIRESSRGRKKGRTHEIQRLIGRSLRNAVDLSAIGERTIWLDCDVLQADGGTRCASVTGSFVALALALESLKKENLVKTLPLKHSVAAVSVGTLSGQAFLDLDYELDSRADVDMNVVMTDEGRFIEVQGTAEGESFTRSEMDFMLKLARKGIEELFKVQKKALKGVL